MSEQTIVLPIALGSKAWAVVNKSNADNGEVTYKVNPITITGVTLWRIGTVRHYISGNHKYLAKNVYSNKEDAERAALELF